MPQAKQAAPTKRANRRGTPGAPLKNYSSRSDIDTILSAIRRTLAESGARRVSFDNDEHGRPNGIQFTLPVALPTGEELLTFRLPARFEQVKPHLIASYKGSHRAVPVGDKLEEQVCRTAWATIRDWAAAQLALIRIGLAKPEEIYFPYVIGDDGKTTYFEMFEHLRLLPAGAPGHSIRITEI